MKLELDTRLSLAFLSGMFLTVGHAVAATLFGLPVSEPILVTGSGLMLGTSAALLLRNRNGNGGPPSSPPPNSDDGPSG